MKNKLFTILIGLAMVAAILPAYKVKAEETGHKHWICGAQHTEKGDHVSDTQTEYSTRLYMKDGKLMHKGTADEIINSMTETVWECFVEKNMVSDFMKKYKISNMKSEADGVILRIISHEKPFVNAQSVEASLEDVFLYYFGEKAGDENAAI